MLLWIVEELCRGVMATGKPGVIKAGTWGIEFWGGGKYKTVGGTEADWGIRV